MNNLEKQLNEKIDEYNLLNHYSKETSFFNDILVYENSKKIIYEFEAWTQGKTLCKNPPDKAQKNVLFAEGVQYLKNLLERYNTLLNNSQNHERKAVYFRMMFESVERDKEINEIFKNNLEKLLAENDKLKAELKKYKSNT